MEDIPFGSIKDILFEGEIHIAICDGETRSQATRVLADFKSR